MCDDAVPWWVEKVDQRFHPFAGYALIARKGFPPAAEDLGAWADVGALRGQRVTIQ